MTGNNPNPARQIWVLATFSLSLVFPFGAPVTAQEPANPNLSPAARDVLNYLHTIQGQYVLAGQEENNGSTTSESSQIYSKTGKYPALRGFETAAYSTDPMGEAARAWQNRGQLVTFGYHMGAPPDSDNSHSNSKGDSDLTRCMTPGTTEYNSFISKLDAMAARLQVLENQGVPILWRPFHEMDGTWFWWSKDGPADYRALWRFTFDYLTHEKGLDNLIWVWAGSYEPNGAWYPGDEYVDIVGTDTYYSSREPSSWHTQYTMLKDIAPGKPAALTECDHIPDPAESFRRGTNWIWFLPWHSEWIDENSDSHIRYVYNHERVITADELPDWEAYVPGETPTPTPIPVPTPVPNVAPFIELDGQVSLEAEHFSSWANGSTDDEWSLVQFPAGYSGQGAMEAGPNNGDNTGLDTTGPALYYTIDFTNTGTYYVHVRGAAAEGEDDSIHIGLDGTPVTLAGYGLDHFQPEFGWYGLTNDVPTVVSVDTPGIHTLTMWMREDGVVIDKLCLAMDALFEPAGLGPDESPRAGIMRENIVSAILGLLSGPELYEASSDGVLDSADVHHAYLPVP